MNVVLWLEGRSAVHSWPPRSETRDRMGSLGSLFKRSHDRSLHFSNSVQIPFRAKLFSPKSKSGKIGRKEGVNRRFPIPCAVFTPAYAQWYFRGIRRNRPLLGALHAKVLWQRRTYRRTANQRLFTRRGKIFGLRVAYPMGFHFLSIEICQSNCKLAICRWICRWIY